MPDTNIAEQYTQISEDYDGWYNHEWPEPVYIQGAALNEIILKAGISDKSSVFDLTCGIGTQCLGLARLGYQVTGMDISPGQLERARAEQKILSFDNPVNWIEGDATQPSNYTKDKFDVILSCGNSLPLLGSVEKIRSSMKECLNLLNDNGLLLISMRDHTQLRLSRPYLMGSGLLKRKNKEGVWIETGEWLENTECYISNIIFVWTKPEFAERHYPFQSLAALTKDEFRQILKETGFRNVEFYKDGESGFAYPLFTARK